MKTKLLIFLLCVASVLGQCGNGRKEPGEQCDSTDAGCVGCVIQAGYRCDGGDTIQADTCVPICGDGLKLGAEACDDGNTVAGDGCDAICQIEAGASCTGGGAGGSDTCVSASCGDGLRQKVEQ